MVRMEPLVLGSGSPRRRELLQTLGLDFEVRVADADETPHPGEPADALVVRLARLKLHAVMRKTDAFVLAADTIVVVDDDVLGKPRNDEDAHAMLRRLSGRAHAVVTAIALGRDGTCLGETAVRTQVVFGAIEADIERYVATGEGRDKAGSYAIQGFGGAFVSRIEGSYSNVVGLPVRETIALLREHGVVKEWP